MATLSVLDNADGTLTLTGSAVTDAGGGLLALAAGPGVLDNGDGTLTLASALSGPVTATPGPARHASRVGPWLIVSHQAGPAASPTVRAGPAEILIPAAGPAVFRTARAGPAELATVVGPATLSSLG